MKTNFSPLLAVLLFSSQLAPGAILLSAWEFEPADVSGTSVAASGGLIAGLTKSTGTLLADASAAAGTLVLDGAGDYLQFGNDLHELRGLSSFSIAAWVKVDPATATSSQRIVEHEDNFYLSVDGDLYTFQGHDDPLADSTTTATGSAGSWVHLVGVYAYGFPSKLYVNGVFEGNSPGFNDAVQNAVQTFQIGARRDSSGVPNWYFRGEIDDVAITRGAPTVAQIEALAGVGAGGYAGRAAPTATFSTDRTIAHYQFSEQSSGGTAAIDDPVTDETGDHDGAVKGQSMNYAEGSGFNGASSLTFTEDGGAAGDRVEVPDSFDLEFHVSESFTVEAVVQTEQNEVGMVVSKGTSASPNSQFWMRHDNGRVRFLLEGHANAIEEIVQDEVPATRRINDGGWHHVAGVHDAEAGTLRLYVDHELVDSNSDLDLAGVIATGSETLVMGEQNNYAANRSLEGDLDAVRISYGALQPSEFLAPELAVSELILTVESNGSDLVFTWDNQPGKVYDLLSSTNLLTPPDTPWAVYDDGETDTTDLPGTAPLVVPLPADSVRFFSLLEKDAP